MKGFMRVLFVVVVVVVVVLVFVVCGIIGGIILIGKDLSIMIVKFVYQGLFMGDNVVYGFYVKVGIEVVFVDYEKVYLKGLKVEIVYFDIQGDLVQVFVVGIDLINDVKVIGVVGLVFFGEIKVMELVYVEVGLMIILMLVINLILLTNGWKIFYCVVVFDLVQGFVVVKFMVNILKYIKVFVVDDFSDYGVGFGDEVCKMLGSVFIGSDKVQVKDIDFLVIVMKVKVFGVDVIYYVGYVLEVVLLLKQLKDVGFIGIFLLGDGMVDVVFFMVGLYIDGVIFIFLGIFDVGDSFIVKWKVLKVFDKGIIGVYMFELYDVVFVFLNGIGDGKIMCVVFLKYVDVYDKKGFIKIIQFDLIGEIKGVFGVFYYLVKGGKMIYKGLVEQ